LLASYPATKKNATLPSVINCGAILWHQYKTNMTKLFDQNILNSGNHQDYPKRLIAESMICVSNNSAIENRLIFFVSVKQSDQQGLHVLKLTL